VFNRYHVGGRQIEALRGAIATLQRRGVEVVLLEPAQVTPDLRYITGDGILDRAQRALDNLAGQFCTPVVDLRQTVPNRDDYEDEVHVDHAGSQLESRTLGRRLAALNLGRRHVGC
jgi:hypothetical protein